MAYNIMYAGVAKSKYVLANSSVSKSPLKSIQNSNTSTVNLVKSGPFPAYVVTY